jgi:hypothetical protein
MLRMLNHAVPGEHPVAQNELLAASWRARALSARQGVAMAGICAALVVGMIPLGVRSWPVLGGLLAGIAVVAACIALNARRPSHALLWLGFALTHVTSLLGMICFGPLNMAPGFFVVSGALFALEGRPRSWVAVHEPQVRWMREAVVVAPIVTVGIALLLEAFGVLPPSMAFRDGAIVILPRAVGFPATLTPWFLLGSNLVVIVAPVILILRTLDRLFDAQRRSVDQVVRLRELVPSEALDTVLTSKP